MQKHKQEVKNNPSLSKRRMMMTMMTVWYFASLSTLFKSYRDDGRLIMQGFCAMKRGIVISWIPPVVGVEPGTS